MTKNGLVSIDDVTVGDLVLARDENTGETSYKVVSGLIDGEEREIWEVSVQTADLTGDTIEETLGTTNEHPWRQASGLWVETENLTAGMQIATADGDRAIVLSVVKTNRREKTYNFEVEGFHTYFVGESGLWVHNACIRDARRAMANDANFRRYFHEWKQRSGLGGDAAGRRNRDMTNEEIFEAYEDWITDGRPGRGR